MFLVLMDVLVIVILLVVFDAGITFELAFITIFDLGLQFVYLFNLNPPHKKPETTWPKEGLLTDFHCTKSCLLYVESALRFAPGVIKFTTLIIFIRISLWLWLLSCPCCSYYACFRIMRRPTRTNTTSFPRIGFRRMQMKCSTTLFPD